MHVKYTEPVISSIGRTWIDLTERHEGRGARLGHATERREKLFGDLAAECCCLPSRSRNKEKYSIDEFKRGYLHRGFVISNGQRNDVLVILLFEEAVDILVFEIIRDGQHEACGQPQMARLSL